MREDILALGERIAEQCVHLDAAMHNLLRDLHTFDQAGGWYQQGFQSCAHWLSWRVGWSLATARDRVRVANRLPGLPKVAAKLESGELSYSKARAIARVATPEIEEALLVYAKHLPAAQLERVCGKVNMVMETRQAIQEGKPRARHERSVQVRPLEDGMACVTAVLTADEAALLMNVIEEVARAQQKPAVEAAAQANAAVRPSRRLPRADGLMTVVQAYARGASPDRTPIDLLITVPVDALQGVPTRTRGFADSAGSAAFANSRRDGGCGDSAESAEAGCANECGDGCDGRCGDSAESAEWSSNGDHSAELARGGMTCVGELPNGTALAPPTLRRLACDAGLVEVSVDARGKPLSVGRKTRAIPASIKRALAIRDRTCRFPSCSNHRFLDGHHIHHWADGGETSLRNLVQLCSHHHRCVHEEGYQILLDEHGQPSFLDPSGRRIIAVPPRPTPADTGWPSIRAANEHLPIDARTGASKWAGEKVNYGYAVDVILGAERQARRQAAQAKPARDEGRPGESSEPGFE